MSGRPELAWSPGAAGPLVGEEGGGSLLWRLAAACARVSPEVFFPGKGASAAKAKRVCSSCPVKAQCLAFALENGERFGVWGGYSERERRQLKGNGGELRRCGKGLHEMTDENTTDGGRCRTCRRASGRRSWHRRNPAVRPRQRLAA